MMIELPRQRVIALVLTAMLVALAVIALQPELWSERWLAVRAALCIGFVILLLARDTSSLDEARSTLDAIKLCNTKLDLLIAQAGLGEQLDTALFGEFSRAAREFAYRGQIVAAIRQHRADTGLGLREAREAIQRLRGLQRYASHS